MKFMASMGAALTLACALVTVASPAFSQTAPRGVVKPQPVGPAVMAPNTEITPPAIAAAPAPEAPPPVTVTWENGLPAYQGVIESIGTKYTMFSTDGAARPSATPGPEKQGNTPQRAEETDEEPDETP